MWKRTTVDLAGLSEEQRQAGSILLGGSSSKILSRNEVQDWSAVTDIVFEWGDDQINEVVSAKLEHSDVDERFYFPVSLATVANGWIYDLAVQAKGWHPDTAYEKPEHYKIIPFEKDVGAEAIRAYYETVPTIVEALGKVSTRYVLFGLATRL